MSWSFSQYLSSGPVGAEINGSISGHLLILTAELVSERAILHVGLGRVKVGIRTRMLGLSSSLVHCQKVGDCYRLSAKGVEALAALLVALILVGVTLIPDALGFALARPGTQFMGTLMNPEDTNSYLAKMQQGFEGDWLYTIPFTAEEHSPGVPWWLLLASRARGLVLWSLHPPDVVCRPYCLHFADVHDNLRIYPLLPDRFPLAGVLLSWRSRDMDWAGFSWVWGRQIGSAIFQLTLRCRKLTFSSQRSLSLTLPLV